MFDDSSSAAAAVNQVVDPMQLMQRVADRILDLIAGADGVLIGLSAGLGIRYVCGSGCLAGHVGTHVDLDRSLAGLAASTGQVLISHDTATDPRVDAEACRRLEVASSVCVPLSRGSDRLGVLAVSARQRGAFNDGDVALLTHLADFVGVATGLVSDLARTATSTFAMEVLSPPDAARMQMRGRIEAILENPAKLTVEFQPIVEIRSGRTVGVEALARFGLEPRRPPDAWFREAHAVGLGVELEILAIRTALAQRLRLPEHLLLSLNAGPDTMARPELEELVGPGRETIIVELTEHAPVNDYPGLSVALAALRRHGVRFAVDDTGSGFASLAHILKLAPDYIKLDTDLSAGIDTDPVRRALASSLVTFAADTGAQIIAEGIETRAALDVIASIGIGYGQGYYLGRPKPLPRWRSVSSRSRAQLHVRVTSPAPNHRSQQ